ncbi:LPS export ABC transporter periplasmic protein LptC [Sphingomonas nostoxanthinifaciens]|uniref:LPS export ABC transporter periplasmic protein LptC n=1 Tax=Sphingomonas nostoxanthinifaciens TaxID=2872652 RepID=UPI001CC1CDDB|nr:LPS export ABC transporter periplasmic protein LptC [Sphingomonas nostoxanthinifaciens]UAK24610.1 LPS export ABC transporter periplasmic protein LptC [Sphingomonas nostoxanthinifaciens]
MSELAERQRRGRREWAAAGSSHDRLIATLRIVLPMAVGVLAAFLALAPLTVGRDISFVLSKDRVDVARERLRVTRAVYRGRDSKEQPFQLTAASAVQATSREPLVRLSDLIARITLSDGPATITSGRGRYDMDTQHVALDGPVDFQGNGGYHITTANVLLDMDQKVLASQRPVTGTMPLGNFSADRLRANLDTHVVDLVGRARLHIVQARSRGAR